MSYTSGSATDRLAAVREAIDRCLAAEAYTVRGRMKQSSRLTDLMKLEERLINEVAAETGSSSMASVGRIVRPS
jgi:hypothetical protein